jgi:arabinofuranan 3-O-arabinosyltransferase
VPGPSGILSLGNREWARPEPVVRLPLTTLVTLPAPMFRVRRDASFTLGFVAAAYAIAFWQKPGWASSDTKIDLHVDPVRFLGDVASVWTPSSGLGEVHSAQYGGYLWPMGPFFALFHQLGVAPWVIQRLWYGLILALAAWGLLLLLDQLVGRPRGIVHLVATTFFLLNPYTVVFTGRTTITLLGYAALPWLLLTVYHGVRTYRGWRAWWWPAAFALIFMSTGGGVNAAVVFYMAFGPLLLMVYEPALGHARWRGAGAFLLRAILLSTLASLWWISALLVHVRYGIDFLQYTEQPRTIWGTNAISESLRLMGYWTSYLGAGYPRTAFSYFSDGSTLLFNVPVVAASLILPALAVLSFVWTRRWRYGPFFVLLVVVGATVMTAGFPNGTPLRSTMDWIYYHVFVTRFLRTVDKAAPLVALGLACLLGLGARLAWSRLRAIELGRLRRPALIIAPVALGALIVLAALPIFQGKALDSQVTWKRIPAPWLQAGKALDRQLPPNSRAIVLPGQIFAYYKWGGTVDAILPRLTKRPVAVRYETPYSDLHADDLLLTLDSLVQQNRMYPGQLRPLLGLIGAGAVVSATDDDLSRSGAVDPAIAALGLSTQGLGAAHNLGPSAPVPPAVGDIDPTRLLPEVRQYNVPPGRGIVHVDQGAMTVVDGSAKGLAQLAAFNALPARAPIFYAGDMHAGAIAKAAASGANVVISDSNRRQYILAQYTQQNIGPVLRTADSVARNEAQIDPFPNAGSDAQTVSILRGATYITAPHEYGFNEFPETAPIAAFDGKLDTTWVPNSYRWIEIGFTQPRDVPYIDVYPLSGPAATVTALEINGKTTPVGRGWNRIRLDAHRIRSLRIRIAHVLQPASHGGPGGLREVRIPGVHVSQVLRSPLVAAKALAGHDLSHASLTFLFSRTTGDDPLRRDRYVDEPRQSQRADLSDRQDPETLIQRVVFAPGARSYAVDARVMPAADVSDSVLDQLVGLGGGASFTSSSRFHNQARFRASSAFDGNPDTAWVGLWIRPYVPLPWIAWRTSQPLTVTHLRITPARLPIRHPTLVQVSWPGGSSPALRVGPDGTVVLPTPARASSFRLTILGADFPPGLTSRQRATRGVGIGSLSVPGLRPIAVPRQGPLHGACGSVRVAVAGHEVPLRVSGTVAQLDAGQPLVAQSCAGQVAMPGGIQYISALPGSFSVDLLRLGSAAPVPVAAPPSDGQVIDPGTIGRYSVEGVRVALQRPTWLVLGESFDTGWKATCDGRSLGAPQVIDGYANGWLAPASCRSVAFLFAPQQSVNRSYVISAVIVALLALLLVFVRPPRGRPASALPPLLEAGLPTRRLPLRHAVPLAVILAIPLGFIFALRAGVVIAPLLTLIFWRGIGPRALAATAAALTGIAIPVAYLITQPPNKGGYNFDYSSALMYAHWMGVAAVILLGMSGWLTVAAARGRRAGRRPPQTPPPWPTTPISEADETPEPVPAGAPPER